MRPSRAFLATSLLAVLAVAGCTSDPAETDDTASETDGLEGSVPDNGWWCRMFDDELVAAVTDGQEDVAREVLRQNDEQGWQCEVVLPVDGGPETEAVLTLTIAVDDAPAADELRAEAADAGAGSGPDYLGESYVFPGTVVAIVPCGAPPSSAAAGSQVPHAISVVAHSAAGSQMTDELVDPARRTIVDLDQTSGCSPKLAERPGGDGSGTTGSGSEG
jgi:hypothetical protein